MIALGVGITIGSNMMKVNAVRAGHGYWAVNEEGGTTFEWHMSKDD